MNSPKLTNILLIIIGILLAIAIFVFYQSWDQSHVTSRDYDRTDFRDQQNPQPFNQQQGAQVNQNAVTPTATNTTMNGTTQIQPAVTFGRATFKSTGVLYKDNNLPAGSSYIGLNQNDNNSEVISQGMNSRSFDPGDSSQITFIGNQMFGSNQYGVYKLSGGKMYYGPVVQRIE
jgi:hypothetical protein